MCFGKFILVCIHITAISTVLYGTSSIQQCDFTRVKKATTNETHRSNSLDTIYIYSLSQMVRLARDSVVFVVQEGTYEVGDSVLSNRSYYGMSKGQFGLFELKEIKIIGLGDCVFRAIDGGVIPFQFEQINDLYIENIDFEIEGTKKAVRRNSLVHFGSCTAVTLHKCRFRNAGGIDFNKCSSIRIISSEFHRNSTKVVELIDCSNIMINESQFLNNYSLYSVIALVYSTNHLELRKCVIKNNVGIYYDDDVLCIIDSAGQNKKVLVVDSVFEENEHLIECDMFFESEEKE